MNSELPLEVQLEQELSLEVQLEQELSLEVQLEQALQATERGHNKKTIPLCSDAKDAKLLTAECETRRPQCDCARSWRSQA